MPTQGNAVNFKQKRNKPRPLPKNLPLWSNAVNFWQNNMISHGGLEGRRYGISVLLRRGGLEGRHTQYR